jgi:GTP pyrophosphokinase
MDPEFDSFTKSGFARLLKIFENTDDVVKITRAFSLASKAHKGQRWNKSEPYVNHPLRIALILAEELHIHDVALACAAMLYDTPKDLSEDLAEFGELPSEMGKLSLHEHKARDSSSGGGGESDDDDTHSYQQHYYEQLSKASREARYLALAERLDTARTLKNQGLLEKAARFKDETQKYVMPMAEKTDDKLAFKLSVALYELK